MHRLALILLLLLVPTGAATADGGSFAWRAEPVVTVTNDGVSWFTVTRTPTLTTVEQRGPEGEIEQRVALNGAWALPHVVDGHDEGITADGGRMVLTALPDASGRTRFVVIDLRARPPAGMRPPRYIDIRGRYEFDAMSPSAADVYVTRPRYNEVGRVTDYTLHRIDTRSGILDPRPIVDPAEPDEPMTGTPLARRAADGEVFTLYGGEAPFVHALDTVTGTARCIDLEGVPRGAELTLAFRGWRQVAVIATGEDEIARVRLR
jgi:hypothetical protein